MRASAFIVGLPTSDSVNSGRLHLIYFNINARYQHEYVTPYGLVAVRRVQLLLYDCICVTFHSTGC